jgi:hypothetical protein
MNNQVRTTITLPEKTYLTLKHLAVNQKTTLSHVVVKTIHKALGQDTPQPESPEFLKLAGTLHEEYLKNPIDLDNFRDEVDWSDL